jgi:large subunit ribosomal protein L4
MDGTVTGTVALDIEVFAVQPNVPVMHQVVTAQRAAGRAGTQSTKTRAEVSGGGAKPFKQKGTGRARQGSTRAPHYAGGGVALGPKPRKYRQRTPRKMVQLALRSALSDRANSDLIVVVDKWQFDVPSTKAAQAALDALGVFGRVLVVLNREDEQAYKSLRNLTDVDLILVGELAAYDVLCSDWLVFSRQTLPGNNVWAEAEVAAEAAVAAPKARPAQVAAGLEAGAGAEEESDEADAPGAEAPVDEAVAEAPVTDGATEPDDIEGPEESEGEEA